MLTFVSDTGFCIYSEWLALFFMKVYTVYFANLSHVYAVNMESIFSTSHLERLTLHPTMVANVGNLMLFPGITASTVSSCILHLLCVHMTIYTSDVSHGIKLFQTPFTINSYTDWGVLEATEWCCCPDIWSWKWSWQKQGHPSGVHRGLQGHSHAQHHTVLERPCSWRLCYWLSE